METSLLIELSWRMVFACWLGRVSLVNLADVYFDGLPFKLPKFYGRTPEQGAQFEFWASIA